MANRFAYSGIAMIALTAIACPMSAQIINDEDPGIRAAEDLVVMIDGRFNQPTQGAGIVFAVNNGYAYIVTSFHVVRDFADRTASDIKVRFHSDPLDAVLADPNYFKADDGKEVAVIRAKIAGLTFNFARLGDMEHVRNLPAYAIGYPDGRDWGFTRNPGAISAVLANRLEVETAYIRHGHSGGALIDQKGRIIGIVEETDGTVAKALRIDHALAVLRLDLMLPVQLTAAGELPIRTESGSVAVPLPTRTEPAPLVARTIWTEAPEIAPAPIELANVLAVKLPDPARKRFVAPDIVKPQMAQVQVSDAPELAPPAPVTAGSVSVPLPTRAEPSIVANPPKPVAAGDARVNPKDGLTYRWIPPGTFPMGCSEQPKDSACDRDNEFPTHTVTLTKGYWMGETEVTQEAYQKVTGKTSPSRFKGPGLPVESVSWEEAKAYCAAAGDLRLPTEAEWEYAARAGTLSATYGDLDAIAWYNANSNKKTHKVGLKAPNGWNLRDMLGNVDEWTADWYDPAYYKNSPPIDPGGPEKAQQYRILRGGSWLDKSTFTRASDRYRFAPDFQAGNFGFRCVGALH